MVIKLTYITNMLNLKYLQGDKETVESILQSQRALSTLKIKHATSPITRSDLVEAQELIKDATEISFTTTQLESIFHAYPEVKAQVIEFGIMDTEVKGKVCSMISNFFLGVKYPTYGDNIPMDKFLDVLKNQATAMGYQVV